MLAESMFLSRELQKWEVFCQENSNGRRGTATTISETLVDLVIVLYADPNMSMTSIIGGGQEKIYSD